MDLGDDERGGDEEDAAPRAFGVGAEGSVMPRVARRKDGEPGGRVEKDRTPHHRPYRARRFLAGVGASPVGGGAVRYASCRSATSLGTSLGHGSAATSRTNASIGSSSLNTSGPIHPTP